MKNKQYLSIIIAVFIALLITPIISINTFLWLTGYLSFIISTFLIWNTLQYYWNKIISKWGGNNGKL